MKFLNDYKEIFFVLGIVSIVVWTTPVRSCSAESSSDDKIYKLPPQISEGLRQLLTKDLNGKYQVAMTNNGSMVIINTETGVLKTYYMATENNGEWSEGTYSFPGSGNLTVTH